MINLLNQPGANYRDPEISPEGPKETAPLPQDVAERNAQLVEEWAPKLYDASATDILEWAHEYAPGKLVVTLSMENTVLAELAQRHLPDADFLFLDTEYHFPETLEVADKVEARYPGHELVRVKAQLRARSRTRCTALTCTCAPRAHAAACARSSRWRCT